MGRDTGDGDTERVRSRNGAGTLGDRYTEGRRAPGDRDTRVAPEPRRDLTLARVLSQEPPNTKDTSHPRDSWTPPQDRFPCPSPAPRPRSHLH